MSDNKKGKEWSVRPDFMAECCTCGKRWQTANAQGVAAQHARKYRHCCRVEITNVRIYDYDGTYDWTKTDE